MTNALKLAALAAVLAMASPTLAQPAPPGASASPGAGKAERPGWNRSERAARPDAMGARWSSMSPEGRQVMMEALSQSRQPGDREALRTARERVTALVAQPQLDVGQLRQAMAEERRLVDQIHARRQEAMIAAFQRLSAEDRQAFANDARAMRERVAERMSQRGPRGGQRQR